MFLYLRAYYKYNRVEDNLPLVSICNIDDEEQQSQDYANDGAAGQYGVDGDVHLTVLYNVQCPVLRWVPRETIQNIKYVNIARLKCITISGVSQGSHLGPLICIQLQNYWIKLKHYLFMYLGNGSGHLKYVAARCVFECWPEIN